MLQEAVEGAIYRRGGEEGSGSVGGQLSLVLGDEWCQREREKATGFTRELCTDADEHRSEEKATNTVRS